MLSGWTVISIVSWAGSLLEIAGSCYGTYASVARASQPEYLYRAATATASMDVFIDILNTGSLCYCLYKQRTQVRRYIYRQLSLCSSDSFYISSNDVIATIVRWTVGVSY